MKTLTFVWGFVAFSILGLEFLPRTETFDALQDFESNFNLVAHPEEFVLNWSANQVRESPSRIFQAAQEGTNGSAALGIQPIGSFNAEIYIKTTTNGLESNRISLQAKTKRNGSGNRPVYVYYSFSIDEGRNFALRQQLGENDTFLNEDSPYQEYEFFIPDQYLETGLLFIKLEVIYGEGSGSAARLFIDDFVVHGHAIQEEMLLEILSVKAVNENQLQLIFNQPIFFTSEKTENSISLGPSYGSPKKAVIENQTLLLEFADYLYSNKYELTIDHLTYGDGKEVWMDKKHSFELSVPTPPRVLLINEFMPDPNPKGLKPPDPGLPASTSSEYIELYNATDKPISLSGFSYNDEAIEAYNLEAGGYVILTSPDQKNAFASFGGISSVANFKTMGNSAGHLSIKDAFGNVVDSLSYSLNWYRDPEKATGGWALERINPFQACSDASNWIASSSPQGGTPGTINAVFDESPETEPFLVERVQPLSSEEITVFFSRPIHQESVQSAQFLLNSKALNLKSSDYQSLTFSVLPKLVSKQDYLLEINNLNDCNGVSISGGGFTFIYDVEGPKIQRIASLSLNELRAFFDEPVKNSTAEVESNYQINGKKDNIQSAVSADSLSVYLNLTAPLLLNQRYSMAIQNIEDHAGNISPKDSIDFLVDDQLDTLILKSPTLMDLFFMTEVDSLSASNPANFSVDKSIGHPQTAFRNADNFQLVHLIFDQDLPQNATGTLTVENMMDPSGKYINTHKKSFLQDNRAISVEDLVIINDSTLKLTFNKPILAVFAESAMNYAVNENIGYPETVVHTDPTNVTLVFGNHFQEATKYELAIKGLRDIYGVEIKGTVELDFIFDLSPPFIEEARLLNPYEIIFKSNEPILHPEDSMVKIHNHEIVRIVILNDREFILSVTPALSGTNVETGFLGLTDKNGNKSDPVVVAIPNEKIMLGNAEIIKEDLIQLDFSAEVGPASALLPGNYLINGESPHEVTIQKNGYEIHLHLQKPMTLGDSIVLEILTIVGKNGGENQGLKQALYYDDGIEELYMSNPQLIQIFHRSELDETATESVVFAIKGQDINLQPLISQTHPKQLQLVLDKPLEPGISYQLIIPPRTVVSQETLPGSLRTINYDNQPPQLILIEGLNENELLLSFNEALDPILAMVTAYYHLDEKEPTEAIPGTLPHQVILVFEEGFEPDKNYTLKVIGLEDVNRNAIVEESMDFVFDGPFSPVFKEIIINELMAAPKSGNQLPDVEYVELYNTGKRELYLGGLSLATSKTSTLLPRETLEPGGYLILTSSNNKEVLEPYGKTLGLSNWPTLLNEGDKLKLLDRTGNLLDEILYNEASYGAAEKAKEGYGLEVVNPFDPCGEPVNLRPSTSAERGTPGQKNSVFDDSPDLIQPRLLKAFPIGDKSISLVFSKRLDPNLEGAKFEGIPFMDILSTTIDTVHPNQLVIVLKESLKENQKYEFSVENIRDCAGNLIDPAYNNTVVSIPVQATQGDLLLNEVLFNAGTGVPKFIEIYNRSNKFINLKDWKLANVSDGVIASKKLIASDDLIIDPFSFKVITTDSLRLLQEYPKGKGETFIILTSLPSYPIAEGTVVFLNPEESYVERFDYDEKFHHSLLTEVRGVSLERYSLDHDVNDPGNWHSASAAEGYATPGYKNSQTYLEGALGKGISIFPEVFVPDAPGEQNFTTINYEMSHPGYVATIRMYSVSGQLIKEICQNDIWGNSGFYIWDGTDLSGLKVRPGYYIVWVQALNLEGRVEHFKKTVVVGSKFR